MEKLLADIRSFLDARPLPLESAYLTQPYSEVEPRLNELREEVKRRGLWAPHLPVALGGRGLSLTEFAQVSALLGETPIGHYLFNAQAPDIGNCELLHTHGTAEQQAKWLLPPPGRGVRR